ncbi:MAG: KpsF/GutQ family sugar-phosphate isomerase [Pseudomonadota bacterium]|nr:KpsF/GutQ family sugar-phosphate isomerase [Pseudomonadota bacterium]|tara:strand:- start:3309 stop:4271 length:963 start_codon:yes stop_codon:yes gene_type:complete
MNKKSNKQLAREIINREITALRRTAELLDNKFDKACKAIMSNKGKVITLGVGKSSFIAMKMAATLSSTGTAALFLHPLDALHGDVGVIKKNDVVIIYSNSGETQEVIKLLPLLKLLKCCIISITGSLSSSLARYSEISLDASVTREACPNNLAPTSSIICALAISDALALAISSQNNFTIKDFAKTHPGGAIGKRLMVTVSSIMVKKNLPLVTGSSKFSQLLEKTTKSNLGLAIIVDDKKKLIGVISDGDIKRIMKKNKNFESIYIKTVMTKKPLIVSPTMLAAEALSVLEDNSISALPVIDKNKVVGILTLKDIIKSIN